MNGASPCALRIGAFELRPERSVLIRGTETHHLEPKICDVLCRLARSHGEVVTRATLLEDVWGKTYGADESLTRAISLLRKIFKADAERLYIETVPKRGYRLAAPVAELTAADTFEEGVEGYHGHLPETTALPVVPPPGSAASTASRGTMGASSGRAPLYAMGAALLACAVVIIVLLLDARA